MGYSVYKITNLINGKSYIGKSKNTKIRFQAHIRGDGKYKNKQYSLISKAISKYGLENFEFEILETFETPEEMNDYEHRLLKTGDNIKPNGYNLESSLDGKWCVHEDTKKLLSDVGQGIRHAHKDDVLSEYIGVVPYGDRFRTFVRIKTKMKSKTFNNETDAARAYDRMVLFLYGENAKLNFNDDRSSYLLEDLSIFYTQFLTSEIPKTSKYKGISKYKNNDKWIVKLDRKRYPNIPKLNLGIFESEIEAAETYDKIIYYFQPQKRLNFPDIAYDPSQLKTFIESHMSNDHSKYQGVCKNSRNELWRSYIYKDGKQINLGSSFYSEEEAHNAILRSKNPTSITTPPLKAPLDSMPHP